jgi:hypothetical protein
LAVDEVCLESVSVFEEATDDGVGDSNAAGVFWVEEEEKHGLHGAQVANFDVLLFMLVGKRDQ